MGPVAMGRLVLVALLGAVCLAVSACGERGEPTGPSSSLYPVTIRPNGERPLVLRQPARRIAVIAPNLESIIADLGAASRIVGTPLAANGTVQVGELHALQPDLIVASSATNDRERARASSAVQDVPIYTAPDDSIRGVERTITELGLITNESVGARRLVHAVEEKQRSVRARLAGVRPATVFLDTGFFTTASNQSLVGDMLREAHATNVAGDSAHAGPFDLDELVRLDPRYLLATSDSGTTLAALRKNPKTRKLGAVRAGRFAIVDATLLEPGPEIGRGLLLLARLVHPDAFR
jgi:cobalamin transport system substrate-binding protein